MFPRPYEANRNAIVEKGRQGRDGATLSSYVAYVITL